MEKNKITFVFHSPVRSQCITHGRHLIGIAVKLTDGWILKCRVKDRDLERSGKALWRSGAFRNRDYMENYRIF